MISIIQQKKEAGSKFPSPSPNNRRQPKTPDNTRPVANTNSRIAQDQMTINQSREMPSLFLQGPQEVLFMPVGQRLPFLYTGTRQHGLGKLLYLFFFKINDGSYFL